MSKLIVFLAAAAATCLLVVAVTTCLELPNKSSSSSSESRGFPVAGADEQLVEVHEYPERPIECAGVKQAELAPESRIVAVHFGGANLNINQQSLRGAQKQPGKQSQEFEIGANQALNSSTAAPSATSCDNKPTGEEIVQASQASTSMAPSTTTPASEPAQPPAAGTVAPSGASDLATRPPVAEASSPAPVGTKTIRQGSAVFCGEANPNGKSNKRLVLDRIVGGRKTEPGEFPFQVRLNIRSRRGSGICGGVILDERHILTAAHCMTACASQHLTTATIETSGVHATVGDHSIKSNDGELELEVERILAHEKYDACNFYANDHDIALITTRTPIEYRFTTDGYGSINRPCMPPASPTSSSSGSSPAKTSPESEPMYRDGEPVIVSGWGVTRENSGSLSNILRYVQVPIVNTTKCQETYGSRVTRDHVCAGYQSGGKDSCQGDSGGPLVRVVENRYELVGIVSFGYGCGQPGAPGVYTRVASYIDWIRANL